MKIEITVSNNIYIATMTSENWIETVKASSKVEALYLLQDKVNNKIDKVACGTGSHKDQAK